MSNAFEGDSLSVRVVWREVRSVRQRFEIVTRPEVALAIPILADGRLVLIRQHRPAIDRLLLEFPAGRLEPRENAATAVRRELLEEAGFNASEVRELGWFLTAPHFSTEVVHVFAVYGQIDRQPAPTEKEELLQVEILQVSDVQKMIRTGQLVDSKSVAAFMVAIAHEIW